MENVEKLVLTDAEWKSKLTQQEYRVLRRTGTEPPRSGKFDSFYPKKGYFVCRGCDNPLYNWQSKFDSGSGWPAFDKCIVNSIKMNEKNAFVSLHMKNTEIICARCESHLGHVFENEGFSETNERHCVNSTALKYVKTLPPKEFSNEKSLTS